MEDETIPVQIYKATIYVTDYNQSFNGVNDFIQQVEMSLDCGVAAFDTDVATIRKWHDNIDVNYRRASKETYEKYFKVNEMTLGEIERELGYKIRLIEEKK